MNSNSYNHVKYIMLILISILALFAIFPTTGYAQNSITELSDNVNASGNGRIDTTGRVFSEIGMGLVGELSGVLIGGGIFAGCASWGGLFGGIAAGELAVTPLTAGGVLLGGWLAGGRGKAGPTFGGAYIGAASGWALLITGMTTDHGSLMIAGGIAIPVLSLVGAVVGYELSEMHETNKLKSERDKLSQAPLAQRSAPIIINLYSGRF